MNTLITSFIGRPERRTWATLSLWVLILFLPDCVSAQKASFKLYTENDGLSSNRILGVAQDEQGFIWVNTYSQLNRFDGYGFQNYLNRDDSIFSFVNKGGEIRTFGEHLVFLDHDFLVQANSYTGRIDTLDLKPFLNPGGKIFPNIFLQISPQTGIIPIVYADGAEVRLVRYTDGICSMLTTVTDCHINDEFSEINIIEGGDGHMYYFHKSLRRIVEIDADGRKVKEVPIPQGQHFRLLQPGQKDAILLMLDDRIYTLSKDSSVFKSHPVNNKFPTQSFSEWYDMYQTASGDLWLSGGDRQLMYYDATNDRLYNFNEEIVQLVTNRLVLRDIFEDRNGTIWIRTIIGLICAVVNGSSFDTHFTDLMEKECGGHCSFRGFAEDESGNVYASFYSNIFRIGPDGIPDPRMIMRESFTPFDLSYRKGKLVLNNGLVLDLSTGERSDPYGGKARLQIDNGLFTVDRSNRIWWTFDNVLYLLEENGYAGHWTPMYTTTDAGFDLFTDLCYDKHRDVIWLASMRGILQYSIQDGSVKHVDVKGLGAVPAIRFIHANGDGLLWLGTEKGLVFLDPEKGSLRLYTEDDGLCNNYVATILPEGDSCLWLGTNKGLSRFHKSSGSFINFYREDGLADNEFNRRSAFRASNGRMYFGGIRGVTAFFPEEAMRRYTEPKQNQRVLLTGFSMTDQRKDSIVELTFAGREPSFDIYYNNRSIQFDVSINDQRENYNTRFSYRLMGLDEIWSRPSASHNIKFGTLPKGEYTLQVKAQNSKGQWYDDELSVALTVHPPWWGTIWAYLLYGVILIGLFLFSRAYELNRQALRFKLELETMEAERLKELDTFKSRLYTNLTHEFRTPLTVILGMAAELKDSKAARLIESNGKNLLRLVNQLLDLSKIEDRSFPLKMQCGDVVPYLRYLTESLQTYANSKNLSLRFYTTLDQLLMDFDAEQLQHILSNLLSNAIKFTPSGGEVSVRVSAISGELVIQVRDTGIGIEEKDLRHVFDRFYQVDTEHSREGAGTGIGLAHSRELARLMGGDIDADSEPGKGSLFTVRIPVTQKAGTMDRVVEPEITRSLSSELKSLETWEMGDVQGAGSDRPLVLIIEDNADVVFYLKTCLGAQYQIEVAYNGRFGIESALELVPDLIISDVMMPEKDGFEVCDTLKNDERTSHIPIILLTARADHESRIAGLRRGADAYLTKPFDKEELLVRLETLMERQKRMVAHFSRLVREGDSTLEEVPVLDEVMAVEDVFMQKVRSIVEEHYSSEEFALPQLCQKLNMSRSQLFRKMKALSDISPSDYIRTFRLQKAKELLLQRDLTVAEVAWAVGFKDVPHFSRSYQEQFGHPPSATHK